MTDICEECVISHRVTLTAPDHAGRLPGSQGIEHGKHGPIGSETAYAERSTGLSFGHQQSKAAAGAV